MAERNFEFRKLLNEVHRRDRRDPGLSPGAAEVEIEDGWKIEIVRDAGDVILQVARDLQDYFFTSMNVSVMLVRRPVEISLSQTSKHTIRLVERDEAPELGKSLSVARSYRIVCSESSVVVCGNDERGVGQGCYYLEDIMNLREAPFIREIDIIREPVFAPRMVHSGWGIDQFPDPHLNAIAHAGIDAILVFAKGVDLTTTGYLDFNDVIDRAARFGLDVYLYSYLISEMHPDDPAAPAYYESTYGALLESCPRAKGIIFVGESCEFPSKDPRTTGRLRLDPSPDGKPDSRPSPGWWPCADYPRWLELLKKIMRRHSPGLDIVFWTYNWGWAPEADRLALIESLPLDISLMATFEMFEDIEKNGINTRCVDYTVSFEGPGGYFESEARAAHERGLRLYTMSNTGGMSWDFGTVPYEPVHFQWARRHDALLNAHEQWGLTGLMESHHYGFWPSSSVTELAKWAYWSPRVEAVEILDRIAVRDFGPEGGPLAVRAWEAWSEAIRDYVPTNEDQYGPFRVGPSFPLLFEKEHEPFPSAPYAHFGNEIVTTQYKPHKPEDVAAEIELLERMVSRWTEGIDFLARAAGLAPEKHRTSALRSLGIGEFIAHSVYTTIHVKKWWLLKERLRNETDPKQRAAIFDEIILLGNAEIANAEATILWVEADSRLGWEPSMEYTTDREHLEWKIAQLRRVLDEEIPAARAE
jgi:hypothetical protein